MLCCLPHCLPLTELLAGLLHIQVLRKHALWAGPRGGNPLGLGSCPGLGDLTSWPARLLTTPVTLGKGPSCRGRGAELVHLQVTQVSAWPVSPGLRHLPWPCSKSSGQLSSTAPTTHQGLTTEQVILVSPQPWHGPAVDRLSR